MLSSIVWLREHIECFRGTITRSSLYRHVRICSEREVFGFVSVVISKDSFPVAADTLDVHSP